MSGGARRISIGFRGGQVLAARVSEKELEKLYAALGEGGWHVIDTEEGPMRIDLGHTVYVSAESSEPHVGFG